MTEASAIRLVMFADVVGSTGLYRQLGDTEAERTIREAIDAVIAISARNGGKLIKTIGDCAMCVFPGPESAASASLEIQRGAQVPLRAGHRILFRIGFAQGPLVERDGDVFGDAVNLASRLCSLAGRGQILMPAAVAALLPDGLQTSVRRFDLAQVKGIDDPVPLVELLWDRRAATQLITVQLADVLADLPLLRLSFGDQLLELSARQMPFSVGRENSCHLVVGSPLVSRFHARFEASHGVVTFVDESANGSWLLEGSSRSAEGTFIRKNACTLRGKGLLSLGMAIADPRTEALLRYEVL